MLSKLLCLGRRQRRFRVLAGAGEAGRQRPPAAVLQRAQARVGGDPVQPRPQRRAALELAVGPPRPDQGLLHLVLGIMDRAEHAVAVCEQLGPEWVGQAREIVADRRQATRLRPGPC